MSYLWTLTSLSLLLWARRFLGGQPWWRFQGPPAQPSCFATGSSQKPENIFKLGKRAKPPESFGLLKEEQRPPASPPPRSDFAFEAQTAGPVGHWRGRRAGQPRPFQRRPPARCAGIRTAPLSAAFIPQGGRGSEALMKRLELLGLRRRQEFWALTDRVGVWGWRLETCLAVPRDLAGLSWAEQDCPPLGPCWVPEPHWLPEPPSLRQLVQTAWVHFQAPLIGGGGGRRGRGSSRSEPQFPYTSSD